MAKIIFEEKLKVVQAYLNGEGVYKILCKWFELTDKNPVRSWCKG